MIDFNYIKECVAAIKKSSSVDEIHGIAHALNLYIESNVEMTYTIIGKGIHQSDTNNKITIIKELRNVFNMGLKEAKDAVEINGYIVTKFASQKDLDALAQARNYGYLFEAVPNTAMGKQLYG